MGEVPLYSLGWCAHMVAVLVKKDLYSRMVKENTGNCSSVISDNFTSFRQSLAEILAVTVKHQRLVIFCPLKPRHSQSRYPDTSQGTQPAYRGTSLITNSPPP